MKATREAREAALAVIKAMGYVVCQSAGEDWAGGMAAPIPRYRHVSDDEFLFWTDGKEDAPDGSAPYRPLYAEADLDAQKRDLRRSALSYRAQDLPTVEEWRFTAVQCELYRMTTDRDGWKLNVEALEETIAARDREIQALSATVRRIESELRLARTK